MQPPPSPSELLVYRVDVEAGGRRRVWALLAPDFVEAARLAAAAAPAKGDRVLSVRPVGTLL
ncbi:MAG: hypothetical protein Q8P41_05565 [Pseudomonadota bacterium]|nr:hypothetical protein [Pseudomonadota bacterium]